MPDVFTKAKRSQVMSRIRSRGNKETELALIKIFRQNKISGWRRHVQVRIVECGVRSEKIGARPISSTPHSALRTPHFSSTPHSALRTPHSKTVRPDFIFPRQKIAVLVDGCFWHCCPRHSNLPVNNRPFWRKKLDGNRARDRLVNRALRRQGWRVIRIWEHELRDAGRCLRKLRNMGIGG